jgi:hypothetical protein
VELPDVMALLIGICHGALRGEWDPALRDRVLTIVFNGLRPT